MNPSMLPFLFLHISSVSSMPGCLWSSNRPRFTSAAWCIVMHAVNVVHMSDNKNSCFLVSVCFTRHSSFLHVFFTFFFTLTASPLTSLSPFPICEAPRPSGRRWCGWRRWGAPCAPSRPRSPREDEHQRRRKISNFGFSSFSEFRCSSFFFSNFGDFELFEDFPISPLSPLSTFETFNIQQPPGCDRWLSAEKCWRRPRSIDTYVAPQRGWASGFWYNWYQANIIPMQQMFICCVYVAMLNYSSFLFTFTC